MQYACILLWYWAAQYPTASNHLYHHRSVARGFLASHHVYKMFHVSLALCEKMKIHNHIYNVSCLIFFSRI